MLIATLIAAGRLDDRLVDRALGLLREVDPKAAFGGWIDEGDALDDSADRGRPAARWALESLPQVDVVVQPAEPRFRKLLVADMDSTIIGQECIDELADFAGLKREVADITERAMQGKLDFKAALRERVALLPGWRKTRSPAALPSGWFPTPAPRPWFGRCGSAAPARCWCRAVSCPSPSPSPG
jgi:phosphoserine phosphatase